MIKKLIEDYNGLIAKAKDEGYNSPKELPLEYLERVRQTILPCPGSG